MPRESFKGHRIKQFYGNSGKKLGLSACNYPQREIPGVNRHRVRLEEFPIGVSLRTEFIGTQDFNARNFLGFSNGLDENIYEWVIMRHDEIGSRYIRPLIRGNPSPSSAFRSTSFLLNSRTSAINGFRTERRWN